MNKYIKLEAVYNYLVPAIKEDYSKTQILSHALQALRELHIKQRFTDSVVILPIVNQNIDLPLGTREINKMYWLHSLNKTDAASVCESDCDTTVTYRNDGTVCGCSGCDPILEETYSCDTIYDRTVCSYRPCINCTLNYTLFYESAYANCITPMKYVGNSSSLLCKKCNTGVNSSTPYTFTVDTDLVCTTNIKEGYVCLDYKCEPKDEEGSFLAPDSPELFRHLANFIMMKYYENNVVLGKENAVRMFMKYQSDLDISYRKVKGKYIQRGTSASSLFKTMQNDVSTFASKGIFH